MLYVATNNFLVLQDLLNAETMNNISCIAYLEKNDKHSLKLYPAISRKSSRVTER